MFIDELLMDLNAVTLTEDEEIRFSFLAYIAMTTSSLLVLAEYFYYSHKYLNRAKIILLLITSTSSLEYYLSIQSFLRMRTSILFSSVIFFL
jgi:hypothetical protein